MGGLACLFGFCSFIQGGKEGMCMDIIYFKVLAVVMMMVMMVMMMVVVMTTWLRHIASILALFMIYSVHKNLLHIH